MSFARPALRLLARQAPRTVARPVMVRGFAATARVNELIKKYTSDHEWISLDTAADNKIATIGITAYAASSLGDVVYVELPELDNTVEAGEAFGAVESVKSASDILSPVAGTVVDANAALNDTPGLINRAPEGEGWIAKIEVESAAVLEGEGLMGEAEYKNFTES